MPGHAVRPPSASEVTVVPFATPRTSGERPLAIAVREPVPELRGSGQNGTGGSLVTVPARSVLARG